MYRTVVRAILLCGLTSSCASPSGPPSEPERPQGTALERGSAGALPFPLPLPPDTVVIGPGEALRGAIGFWPPESYGGWGTAADDRHELVIETDDDLLVFDTRTGHIAATVRRPDALQINAVMATDDSVWVADHDAGEIVRLDRESGRPVARVSVGGRAVSLLRTSDGVWAGSAHVIPESVLLINPMTNGADTRIESGAFPGYGLDSLWFGRDATSSTLAGIRRIDPGTGDVLATIDLGKADGCYVGGSFPDAVWSHCFAAPSDQTVAGRLDLEANRVVATVDLGAAASLIGVTDDSSYFLVTATADLPARLVAIDNATNEVDGVYAFDAPEPPFDMAAVIGDALWFIDVEDGELRTLALSELPYEDQAAR